MKRDEAHPLDLTLYFTRLGIPYATMRDYAQAARDEYHEAHSRRDEPGKALAVDMVRRVLRLIRTDIDIWDD